MRDRATADTTSPPADTTLVARVLACRRWDDPAPPPADLILQMVLGWVADDRREWRRSLGLTRRWSFDAFAD
jgi:hypothetical protein